MATTLENLLKDVTVKGASARFGVLTKAAHKSGRGTVREIAQWNVDGSPRVPARPFMDVFMAKQAPVVDQFVSEFCNWQLLYQWKPREAAVKLGKDLVAALQAWIRSGATGMAPNAPRTIARKGHGIQLVETHQTVNSIRSQVVK